MKLKLLLFLLPWFVTGNVIAVNARTMQTGVTLAHKKATENGACNITFFVNKLSELFGADFRPINDIDDKQYYEHLKLRGVVGFVYIDGQIPYVVFKDGHTEKAGTMWGNLVVASGYSAEKYMARDA